MVCQSVPNSYKLTKVKYIICFTEYSTNFSNNHITVLSVETQTMSAILFDPQIPQALELKSW